MLEEKDLQALATLIDAKLKPVQDQLDEIKQTLDEHTTALDTLIEWTEHAALEIRIPFAEPKNPG